MERRRLRRVSYLARIRKCEMHRAKKSKVAVLEFHWTFLNRGWPGSIRQAFTISTSNNLKEVLSAIGINPIAIKALEATKPKEWSLNMFVGRLAILSLNYVPDPRCKIYKNSSGIVAAVRKWP